LLSEAPANQPAEWLGTAMGLLRRFSLGFSRCPEELLALVAVPSVANADVTARITDKADRIFEQGRDSFLSSARRELEQLCSTGQRCDDFEMAARLSRELCGAAESIRHRILRSHLHMTANRLGLRNSDEIYLMRILERSFAELAASDSECLSRIRTPRC
ncbi:MAG TPA: lantibiotic dehydratase C-terminal domain-containing protein, partial [Thermoanaerobaculia bacterium]|nr:lantibiotic dehydratase C-terminal domain-containing protein [Thermoanaerobaculia bacterium]